MHHLAFDCWRGTERGTLLRPGGGAGMRRMAAAVAVLVAFGALVAPARRALAVGTARVDVGDASVTEGDSGRVALRFVVTLSEPASTAVTMSYAATGDVSNPDHATSPDDFLGKAGTLTFAAG